MFHDKLIYYRKKNMLTQEELAEKLCVSRQTITKWENGMITPGLEYMIDLSHIFGITIDRLIKDDDCFSDTPQLTNTNQLIKFLVEAKKQHMHLIKIKFNLREKIRMIIFTIVENIHIMIHSLVLLHFLVKNLFMKMNRFVGL